MEGVELKEEWQDEDFPRYCRSSHNVVKSCMIDRSQLCVICTVCVESHMNNNPIEGMITSCLIIRPLPEEEELEDELFAGTSEEGAPGNETD